MKVDVDHVPTSLASHEMPMVSIVITAYNAERFIGACITASLAQTYQNFEVLVVDDGSTDGTAQICHSIPDPRFRYVTWGRLGRPRALNAGIAEAKGEYIAINDADDLSLPHRLQYSMHFMREHPEMAYLGTGFAETNTFHETIPDEVLTAVPRFEKTPPVFQSRIDLFQRNLFNNSTLLYPKSTWQRITGYDEQLSNSEDYDFYLRALQCGPAALLPGQTVLWYTNPNGYFKRKNKREHLGALGFIKRRAHRLLNLPGWLRLYHPLWVVWFELVQRFPSLLEFAKSIKGLARRPRLTRPV
jgi:glycosyltransferase involved in cell wall biosynthesis